MYAFVTHFNKRLSLVQSFQKRSVIISLLWFHFLLCKDCHWIMKKQKSIIIADLCLTLPSCSVVVQLRVKQPKLLLHKLICAILLKYKVKYVVFPPLMNLLYIFQKFDIYDNRTKWTELLKVFSIYNTKITTMHNSIYRPVSAV